MSMTKKDFIALADAMRPLLVTDCDGAVRPSIAVTGERVRTALVAFCYDQNPYFDKDRWLGYLDGTCGPNGGKV